VAMSSNISFSCKRHSFAIHGCDLDQEVIIMTLLLLNSARSLRASNIQSCLVKESLSVWQFWLLNILDTANDSQGPL
jgi:hypothetical protein